MCSKTCSTSETFHMTRIWVLLQRYKCPGRLEQLYQSASLFSCQPKKTTPLSRIHTYYEKSSKALRPLLQGEVVRLATSKGHDRIGLVKQLCDEPRSYLVQSEGKEYRRNRKHILPISKPPSHQLEHSEMTLPFVQTT